MLKAKIDVYKRQQEVQTINHWDDKLRADFRALLYKQDVDDTVN